MQCITGSGNFHVGTWEVVSNSLDINLIHGHIYDQLCKKTDYWTGFVYETIGHMPMVSEIDVCREAFKGLAVLEE